VTGSGLCSSGPRPQHPDRPFRGCFGPATAECVRSLTCDKRLIPVADPEAIISRALELGTGGADRQDAAEELMRMSAGQREPLESARDHFVARLHGNSADYDATKALQLINVALPRVPWPTAQGDG
jgi:hypothetical protein